MMALLKGFDLLPGWAWALLFTLAISTAAINANHLHEARARHAGEVAAWERERATRALEHAQAQARARAKEQAAQAAVDQAQQEKRREIDRLHRRHAAALDSLRNRPERPSDISAVPEAAGDRGRRAGCTGGELYRADAEFLLGEALRADRIRLQLAACQAAYGAAREVNP